MAVCKCKMCGGDLNITELDKVAECEYCGTVQTVPSADNEKKMALFNRANKLRLNSEFDKAAGIYESVIADFPEEAEAYWGLVLCKYGIEYVDDPATGKKIPTCHRSSFDSVMEDGNFDQACENADTQSRRVYREEAKRIEEIRKGIIEVSSKEEPYDIFICYKETDENGDRTVDSAIAQDVYTALTEKGYRVFFSRISLEDKLGQEYEPYIFAALNSAKIMLAFGTDYEYYNAVWVKNEWSRFLQLIAAGQKKTLIPCYKDIDAYDMPKEFAKLQAQDMGKVGAIQDLLRGIEKILPNNKPAAPAAAAQTVVANPAAATTVSLLDRAFLFLEDGDWESANEYAEKVLDIDPRNGEAYLVKLMAELEVRRREDLQNREQPFDGNNHYQKAMRFGNEALQKELQGYIEHINESNEEQQKSAEQKAASVAQALNAEERLMKEEKRLKALRSDEEKLAEVKSRIEKLERIRNDFSEARAQLRKLQMELNAMVWREGQLTAQRSGLGIFAGKEKKQIDEELAAITRQKNGHTERIGQLQKPIGGYVSEADVERDLNKERIKASELARQIESETQIQYEPNNDVETLGYAEALAIYLREPDVAAIVNAQLYPNVSRDSVVFGKYAQKQCFEPKPIEWQVLARENGRMLLICKYALDCKPYNTSKTDVTWETSSLRKWLNGVFISAAFSAVEQNMIFSSTVSADKNPLYSTPPGSNTTDRVFLLSITEVNKYFSSDSARQCQGTAYCYAQGAKTANNGNCWWRLRSPGGNSYHAAFVHYDGSVYYPGSHVDFDYVAVRPALWINLGS